MSKISICVIATRMYKNFVPQLIEGIEKYFLVNHERKLHIFTDKLSIYKSGKIKIVQHLIPAYGHREATLYRYKIMSGVEYDCDYVFYLDADMSIVSEVGDEILNPIVAVRHPGYFNGGGAWGNIKNSLSYTEPEKRKRYYAGGFWGMSRDHFVAITRLLKERIDIDERNGITAEWRDETHWNWFLAENGDFLELDCSYCMAESIEKRKKWGINYIEPKILALEKDLKTHWTQ